MDGRAEILCKSGSKDDKKAWTYLATLCEIQKGIGLQENMGNKITHEEVQKIELELLKQFADYCDKHDLRYYLDYGTLIGAVRHEGFIPWDNDVDVVMPRPDYERFIKMVKQEKIADHMDILDYREVRTFPFLKIIDNRTILKEHFLVTEDNLGVYLDVFPLDGFPEDSREQLKLINKAKVYYKLYAFANYRFNTGANWKMRMIKNVLYPFSRLVSSRWVCRQLNYLCSAYDYDQSEYVGDIVWGFDEREIVPRKYFEKQTALFENNRFSIPAGYHEYLQKMYGDYMKLPPEEKRVIHEFEAYWKDEAK